MEVQIYETLCPGAVWRVTHFTADGKESELWKGKDPTPVGAAWGVSKIKIHPKTDVRRIKIYIDSQRVPDWNEIDAVGLVDAEGTVTWAAKAYASSSFGVQTGLPDRVPPLGDSPQREPHADEAF